MNSFDALPRAASLLSHAFLLAGCHSDSADLGEEEDQMLDGPSPGIILGRVKYLRTGIDINTRDEPGVTFCRLNPRFLMMKIVHA